MTTKTTTTAQESRRSLWIELAEEFARRLRYPALALVVVFVFGTVGFYLLGGEGGGWLESAYMTSITLTTVGYGEIFELGRAGRIFAMMVMWFGVAGMLYATATATAFIVEKDLGRLLRERRMEQRISKMENHYIVCGAGETGSHIIRELYATKQSCVVIELDPARAQWLSERFEDLPILRGDATEEDVLIRAGIERAQGIFAVLSDDGQNMLITVLARFISREIKIVSQCRDNSLANKFYRAGASYVVNPMFIGGMRMASEMIRPQVVTFLDRMLRGQSVMRVEEVRVGAHSALVGKTLQEADIYSRTGLTPLALEIPERETVFNPAPGTTLEAGAVIIVIGNPDQVAALRAYCA